MEKPMTDVKTLEDWEKTHGIMLSGKDGADVAKKMTETDFNELLTDQQEKAQVDYVNHDDRVKFLKDNGYEVTRENMVDSTLSARPQEDEPAPPAEPVQPVNQPKEEEGNVKSTEA